MSSLQRKRLNLNNPNLSNYGFTYENYQNGLFKRKEQAKVMHPCNQGGWGRGENKQERKKMKPVATCTSNYVIESLWCPTKLKFI